MGAIWTPNSRTAVEAGWQDQFFGSNFFLDLKYEGRRSIWTATYSEELTTDRDRELGRQVVGLNDAFGDPIDPLVLDETEFLSSTDSSTLNDDTEVLTRLDTSFAYKSRRNTYSVSAFHEIRDFESARSEETVSGFSATVSRQLSRQMTARATTSLTQTDFSDGNTDDTTWRSSVSVSQRLADNLSGTLKYSRNVKESSIATSEYEENRISAALVMTF